MRKKRKKNNIIKKMLQISKANVMLKRGTRRKKIHSINYSSSDINPYNENIEKYKIFSPKTMHKLLFLERFSLSFLFLLFLSFFLISFLRFFVY